MEEKPKAFRLIKEGPPFTEAQIKEFKKVCLPVAKFMRDNCCPMQTAVISEFDCRILSHDLGGNFTESELGSEVLPADEKNGL